ncbi:MAG: CHAT domain-containing protein [Desulfomonile tiedjei]|nr:CHAT domain-containing protein [Desulfomonile tiedjei]
MKNRTAVCAVCFVLSLFLVSSGTARSNDEAYGVFKEAQELHGKAFTDDDMEKAAAKYRESLAINEKSGDLKGQFQVLRALGSLYEARGRLAEAGEYWNRAFGVAGKIADGALEAQALDAVGELSSKRGLHQEATDKFHASLAIKGKLGDAKGEAATLDRLGAVYRDWGRYDDAVQAYEKLLGIARKLKSPALEATALARLGLVSLFQGDYGTAKDYLAKSLEQCSGECDREIRETVLINLGYLHRDRGDFAQALDCFGKALESVRESKDQGNELLLLNNLGELHAAWGEHLRSAELYQEALDLARQTRDRKAEAQTLTRIGRLFVQTGQDRKALEALRQADAIARDLQIVSPGAEELMGNLYLSLGEIDQAKPLLERVGSDASLGRLRLAEGDYRSARKHYESLLRAADANKRSDGSFTAYTGIGQASEALKDYARAEDAYGKALQFVEDLRSSLPPAARRAFFAGRVNGFSRAEPARGFIRVKFKQGTGAETVAVSELTRARAFADRLAVPPANGYAGVPKEVQDNENALVTRLAGLKQIRNCCSRRVDPTRYENLTRQIDSVEKELNSYIDLLWKDYPHYAAVKYPRSAALEQLKLDATGYVLIFDLLGEGVGIKLLKGKQVVATHYEPWNTQDVEKGVAGFRSPFEQLRLVDFNSELGHALYKRLVAPLLAKVPEGSPLLIIPDGMLALLPFEALVVKGQPEWKDGPWGLYPTGLTYLGDLYPIAYQPSLAALSLRRAASQEWKGRERILVIADPVFEPTDERVRKTSAAETGGVKKEFQINLMAAVRKETGGNLVLPRLPETSKLAEDLERLYGKNITVYSGLKAAKDVVFAELAPGPAQYSDVVFATHGIYGMQLPGIMEPALALSLVPVGTDGFLRMTEVMSLEVKSDTVVLTACETAVGEQVSGEGVMSMGRAFQYAGARDVLMTLWSVAESASVELVERFFKHRKEGKGDAEALSLARRDIRSHGYEHPFFWAPFVLLGE